ncbi:hypothetical protein PsexTeo8_23040 [Pseudomonas extremaustralis]|nr:hypothetical protein [Pseudomonas extremaustralis]
MKRASRATGASRFLLLGLGVIIALLGLALAVGGVRLVSLGGSWYFLIGGVAMALAGLLIARRNTAGAWLFAAFWRARPFGRWRMWGWCSGRCFRGCSCSR